MRTKYELFGQYVSETLSCLDAQKTYIIDKPLVSQVLNE
jgi:hypothetical protein